MESKCPPHNFSDGGSVIFCSQCGTQIRKLAEDSNSVEDSIDELLKTLEVPLVPAPQPPEEAPLLLSFSIIGHEVRSNTVYYFLRITNNHVPVCTCTIRYNHLKSFHDSFKLGKVHPFPPKEILSFRQQAESFIESRTEKLNEYLAKIAAEETVNSSALVLAHFIGKFIILFSYPNRL
eukprot:TRINITY_DN9334_c0_g1_i2.p1 TRINITY_DN9334_c0_g1~~TRINITY_DN9334_c0_g1_i2.p1  ORF type:complete len:178 (+),score=33.62 TRINITY_DN9334_c0_g1_i2:1-534(+)